MLALLAACGPASPDDVPKAASEPSLPGQILLEKEAVGWLYSDTEGTRSLGSVFPLDLSRDGSSVLVTRSRLEPSGITRRIELVVIDASSKAERVLVRAGDREGVDLAQWSPDGSQVAYRLTRYDVDPSESVPGPEAESICLRTLSSPNSRCLDPPDRVYSFDWSPDGDSLLVAGPGNDPVRHVDAESGSDDVVIPPGGDQKLRAELDRLGYGQPAQFVHPQWSPSGRYIAALVSLRGGSRMYVPTIFTSEGAFVSIGKASGEFPDAFAWSPQRDVLAYTQGEAPYAITAIYVHDPADAIDDLLATTENEGPMIPRIDALAWSPDGRRIAFSRPRGIRILDVEGGEPARELDVRGTVVDWAPWRSSSTSDASNEAAPAPTPSTLPSDRSAICERIDADACGEREGLRHAEAWLGDRLSAAGFAYLNGYRPDGGGGHVNPRWNFSISALRPTTATPDEMANRYGDYRRLWSTNGVTIFGRARERSPVAYFYWRAGGVDTWVHLGWKASQAARPQDLQQAEDLRQVFRRIVDEQERDSYPYKED